MVGFYCIQGSPIISTIRFLRFSNQDEENKGGQKSKSADLEQFQRPNFLSKKKNVCKFVLTLLANNKQVTTSDRIYSHVTRLLFCFPQYYKDMIK